VCQGEIESRALLGARRETPFVLLEERRKLVLSAPACLPLQNKLMNSLVPVIPNRSPGNADDFQPSGIIELQIFRLLLTARMNLVQGSCSAPLPTSDVIRLTEDFDDTYHVLRLGREGLEVNRLEVRSAAEMPRPSGVWALCGIL
jgi:hypothetical protein